MCPHVSHGIVLQTKSSPAFQIECLVSISNGLNCNLCLENFCLGARFAFFFESGCFVVVVVLVLLETLFIFEIIIKLIRCINLLCFVVGIYIHIHTHFWFQFYSVNIKLKCLHSLIVI